MTTKTQQYWSAHVGAVKAQAITAKAYAHKHGLVLSTLYYWQCRLKSTVSTLTNAESVKAASPQPSKFVHLQLRKPDNAAVQARMSHCTLVMSAGIRLEMSELPNPLWLTALARCNHGIH